MVQKGFTFIGKLIQSNYEILREGYEWFLLYCVVVEGLLVFLVALDDTSFSLSHLFGASIDELLDVFEIIGFVKKVEKKELQFMRFKFTNFINQNGLDQLVDHNVCKYKGKNEHFIRLGQGEEDKEQKHFMESELELLAEERIQMKLDDEKAKV